MNEVPSPQLRISDQDRESALQALGEHMSVGRIDIDEYGERSASITAVKTRGELAAVFDDLPQPHPVFDQALATTTAEKAVEPAAETGPAQPERWTDRPLQQRLAAAIVPVMWVAGLILFFTTGSWFWFLLPVAFTGVGRAMWGQDWHDSQHGQRRELREDRRANRRELGR